MTVRRPALRYPGAKWELAPWIISHFPAHRVYTEAYGGGGSVLLRKPRAHSEIYNDQWGEIVNLFRVLRSPVESQQLARLVHFTPFSRREYDAAFLASGDPIEQARRNAGQSSNGIRLQLGHAPHGVSFRHSATRGQPRHGLEQDAGAPGSDQ